MTNTLSTKARRSAQPRGVNQNSRAYATRHSHVVTSFTTKIHDYHLGGIAIVYVRQSSPTQVINHQESTELQYKLVELAVELGWSRDRVLVIDDDQAESATTAENRIGFQRLMAEIGLDHVGIVFGIEMSRIARSNLNWHQLLELCGIFRTLLADVDGVYDPTDFNDRLLLGLKGTMSEAELHILKNRLQQAWWNKAERGDLLNHPPIGYVRTLEDDYELDPDEQAQSVVRLVFEQFERQGNVNAMLRYLVKDGVKLPVRPHCGPNRGRLQWRRPNRVTLLNMLHHPIYAGAYRWGHRQVDPRKKVAGKRHSGRTVKSYDQCRVLIHDRFDSYITWEKFLDNQRRLIENRNHSESLRVVRNGPSMLSGLVVCGRCGHRMIVSYGSTNDLRYNCQREAVDYGGKKCISFSGKCLETFVAERILEVIQPASLELSLRVEDDLKAERQRLDVHWQQRLERTSYECDRAFRQYQAVEPEHRLVARQLEQMWEEVLKEKEQLEEDYARFQQTAPIKISAEEQALIASLSDDLPALWYSTTTTPEDRQEISRALLDRVVVNIEGESEQMDVTLHWAGGFVSHNNLRRPVQRYEQLSNYRELLNRIKVLRRSDHALSEIARSLNREGFHPPKQDFFTAKILRCLLRRRTDTLQHEPQDNLASDEWWIRDLADQLTIPTSTIRQWRKAGWIHARKDNRRWVLWADAEEQDRLRRLRARRRGWPEPYPQELTTPKPHERA